MKVYKVVRKYKGQYYSCGARGKAVVRYQIGEWAEAPKWLADKGYHLTAFYHYIYAKSFIASNFRLPQPYLFEAEAEDIIRGQIPEFAFTSDLRNGKILTSRMSRYVDWPLDTIMAKRIKLIMEVTND